jgi:hypothetical protein
MTNDTRDRDHRDLLTFNRQLVAAMRRRDRIAKQLTTAEARCEELRGMVRALIDRLKNPAPPPLALCQDCGAPIGTTATCLTCQTAHAMTRTTAHAHPENP